MNTDAIDKGLNALMTLFLGFGIFLAFILFTSIAVYIIYRIATKKKDSFKRPKGFDPTEDR